MSAKNVARSLASASRCAGQSGSIWFLVLALPTILSACTTAEINEKIDTLNRSIKGSGAAPSSSTPETSDRTSAAPRLAADGSVSFRRRLPGGTDIVRASVEDGAMQLRVGADFTPGATVDNVMPYRWSASCDLFYLVAARLPNWKPPVDKVSGFTFDDACALNEGGLAFGRSAYDDPVRRNAPNLSTSFGVADTIARWRPVSQMRRAEVGNFRADRFFFVGVRELSVRPYDPATRSFLIRVDLSTGYGWNKPIVLVGKQLSDERFNVNLKTEERLARLIDEARSSNARLPARQLLVVFKLNSVTELPNRIELNVTLEKIQIPVYGGSGTLPTLVDVI